MKPNVFPIGFHQLHPDISMNFQMNRSFSGVGEKDMLDEMRSVAPRIANYADWKREFLKLAETASAQGHTLRAGNYYRSAEFFMRPDDPDRKTALAHFLAAIQSVYELDPNDRYQVPYSDGAINGFLPAYRFTSAQSKGTIVLFGGFDSYIEELTAAILYLRDQGYEVIAFEGPGQGGALNDSKLPMTPDWHKPVKVILDYFKRDHVTLCGLSLGGCLVMRAAAYESRIDRVIAYDVFPDALEVNLRQVSWLKRHMLNILLRMRARAVVNLMASRVARTSPVAEWGFAQGMHVTGTSSPYDYLKEIAKYTTADVSPLITQDVLLLAGNVDHFVPVEHFYRQIRMLKNARSISARLFTEKESAGNHNQIGNYGLALRTIVNWIDALTLPVADQKWQSAIETGHSEKLTKTLALPEDPKLPGDARTK